MITDADPFELPEWLGTEEVVWRADEGLRTGHHVLGELVGPDGQTLPCDLLAADRAAPTLVTDEASRVRAHQAWQLGEVLVGEYGDRLTLAVPGTRFRADLVMEALSRLARAVGASPERYTVMLRIGSRRPHQPSGDGR